MWKRRIQSWVIRQLLKVLAVWLFVMAWLSMATVFVRKLDTDTDDDDKPTLIQDKLDTCPHLYNITDCHIRIDVAPRKSTNEDTGFDHMTYKVVVLLNSAVVYSWHAAGGVVMAHVNPECTLVTTRQFMPQERNSETDNVGSQIARFVDRVPRRHLVLGSVFGVKGQSFCGQVPFVGPRRKSSARPTVCNADVMAFLLCSGYPANSVIRSDARGRNSIRLTNVFHFGHKFEISKTNLSENALVARHSDLSSGGTWKPKSCTARSKIAIIIPFRNREANLRIFLDNIIPFLQRQLIEFRILVIEQAGEVLFNRARLMNIGYKEAQKFGQFDCYVFHDVDEIPEDLANSYHCSSRPRHLVVARNIDNYTLPYKLFFGAGIMLTKQNVESINGFPNKYFGWGGEDDDIQTRLIAAGMHYERYPEEIARYYSLNHTRDMMSTFHFRNLYKIRRTAARLAKTDGLHNLEYDVISCQELPLYTHIMVTFTGPTSFEQLKLGGYA